MKVIFSTACYTDHNFHGQPIEVTRIEIKVSDSVSESIKNELIKLSKMKLRSLCKNMPYWYWKRS